MSLEARRERLGRLEEARGSKVLAYVLSDRETFPQGVPGFAANLGTEPQLLFVRALKAIGHVPKLDLFLYTRGGSTDSVWPLVSILREHCNHLSVIVPFRAHSGGTLIALGADEIVMLPAGELSPIDPTTGNQFNPVDPHDPSKRYGISVEDVAAYFQMCDDRAGITQEPYRLEVLRELTKNVHPLALGNVQRVYLQIRQLAKNLLELHLDAETHAKRIDTIVEALATKFYSHVHAVNRQEALSLLEDRVRFPDGEEESAIDALFQAYSDDLDLGTKFSLPEYMGDELAKEIRAFGGFIDSSDSSYVLETRINVLQRPKLPPNVTVQTSPGQAPPLTPWAGREYDFGIKSFGWKLNAEGA